MQTIRWYRLLTAGMLAVPIAGKAQGLKTTAPSKPAQSGVAGKWYPDATLAGELSTLLFKPVGATLTGSVSRGADTVAIYDGKINGNSLSLKFKSKTGGRTITLIGKIGAATIAFTRDVKVDSGGNPGGAGLFGALGARTFTATRVPPTTALSVTNRVQGPQPKITEIATISGADAWSAMRMPNRHVVIYNDGDSLFAYDMTTKRSTFLAGGFGYDLDISPQGDRIAYTHRNDEYGIVWAVNVDPATGAPTAPAQRVTLNRGDTPTFSPDGKYIAFAKARKIGAGGWRSLDLAVVPASGGTERVLAQFEKGFDAISWSTDGKWIYVQESESDPITVRSILRVPVEGGSAESFLSYAHLEKTKGTIDSRFAFFYAKYLGRDRMGYVTSSGKWGDFTIPHGSQTGNWNFAPPEILVSSDFQPLLHIIDLGSGKVRDVPVDAYRPRGAADQPRNFAWSVDQKQLAFETGDGASHELVVIGADGAGQRRFPVKDAIALTSWSPDGSGLVYVTDSARAIRMLNVSTGTSRLIGSVPAGKVLYTAGGPSKGRPMWRPDGKSILMITCSHPRCWNGPSGKVQMEVVEFRLNGTSRVVRDLSAEFPSLFGAVLISHRQVLVEFADIETVGKTPGVPKVTRLLLVPLDGGAAKSLTMPPLGEDTWARPVTASSDKWLASLIFSATNESIGLQFVPLGGDSPQVTRFPEHTNPVGRLWWMFLSGNNRMVALGNGSGHDVPVTSFPLDGKESQIIAQIPRPIFADGGAGSVSPDGKFLAYFSWGPTTAHVYDVDLASVYQLINKKP